MATQQLTLISRGYCHLCHDMEVALTEWLSGQAVTLNILDVDADPALEARYDELVPVLLAGDGSSHQEICHYFLDIPAVQAYLAL